MYAFIDTFYESLVTVRLKERFFCDGAVCRSIEAGRNVSGPEGESAP